MERHHFEDELQALKNRLLEMGALVEDRVHRAVHSLIDRKVEEAEVIISADRVINDLHIEIDDRCFKMLALYQPMAVDLRAIVAAVKVNTDLERVGDLAVNIAEAAKRSQPPTPAAAMRDIPGMSAIAQRMLRDALDAFVKRDTTLARAVLAEDDSLDDLKTNIGRDLLACMRADHKTIEGCLQLILVSRHLERVGDHATNIAEDVIFMVSARDVRHHAADG
jgi:phosphate transport system protein